MARLSAAQRRALPSSAFAIPSKAPGPGSYPIPDAGHAQAAKGRAAQFATPATQKRVDAKANDKLAKAIHRKRHGTHKRHHGRVPPQFARGAA